MGRRSGKLVRNYGLDARLEVVKANKEARSNRSPQEQLKVLDQRLGKDQGATKERARLIKQIEDAKAVKAKKESAEPKPKVKAKDRNKKSKKSADKAD